MNSFRLAGIDAGIDRVFAGIEKSIPAVQTQCWCRFEPFAGIRGYSFPSLEVNMSVVEENMCRSNKDP